MARSPKGLITNEPAGPEDSGIRFEPIGPGKYAIVGPDTRQDIDAHLKFWERWASLHIETKPPTPEQIGKRMEFARRHVKDEASKLLERWALRPIAAKPADDAILDRTAAAHGSSTGRRSCATISPTSTAT